MDFIHLTDARGRSAATHLGLNGTTMRTAMVTDITHVHHVWDVAEDEASLGMEAKPASLQVQGLTLPS